MFQVIIKEDNNIIIQKEINDIQELEDILPKEYEEVQVKKVEDK